MDGRELLARAGAALNPLLARDMADFTDAERRFTATRPEPRTIAVVGMTPGEGRSSVSALLALAVAGWSDRRITVLDAGVGPGPAGSAGNSLTALLGGDPRQGRLANLLGGAPVVSRRRLHDSRTPGAAVPVLSSSQGFAPEQIESTVLRLRHRADLVVIDTPAAVRAPVLPPVLTQADLVVLVARADGDVDLRVQSALRWLASTPARPRVAAVMLVARGWSTPQWIDPGIPVLVLPRDEGLRCRRVDRIGRQAITAGLQLATTLAQAPTNSAGTPGPGPSGLPAGPMVGSPPHPEGLREPVPRR